MPELIEHFRTSLDSPACRLFFSPDGNSLVSVSKTHTVIWNTSGERVIKTNNSDGRIDVDSFAETGDHVALPGTPARIISLSSGTEYALRRSQNVRRIKISPGGKSIMGVLANGGITLWTMSSLEPKFEISVRDGGQTWSHEFHFEDASFRGDSQCLVALGHERHAEWGLAAHHGEPDEIIEERPVILTYDVNSGDILNQFDQDNWELINHDARPKIAQDGWFSADLSTLVVRLDDDTILTLDASDLSERNHFVHPTDVEQLYVSSDGKRIVTVDENRTARMWFDVMEMACETIVGSTSDPRNGFGLPAGKNDPLPCFRILAFDALIVVETWPGRETVLTEYCPCPPTAIAVQPGSNSKAFAVADVDGEVALFHLRN